MSAPLLDVRNLSVDYRRPGLRGTTFRAVDGASLHIARGETLGLVGESGSGKSTIGRAVLGLAPVAEGSITFAGTDITHLGRAARRRVAGGIQVVFQDPYSSLNPSMTIEQILAEPLTANGVEGKRARARVRDLLDSVRLPADAAARLPKEFSGGQRQRIAIARALALEPKLIVADEAVSALDLSTQARVLDLFVEIQESTGVAYLFVTHDLAVVRNVSHRVAVLYRGEIVEQGSAQQVTTDPEHPYTQRLLMAAPVPDPDRQEQRRAHRLRLLETQREQDVQAGAGAL